MFEIMFAELRLAIVLGTLYSTHQFLGPFLAPTVYIDPNTGGMLFQLLAVLFGVISGIFLFFSGRIKGFFYKIRRRVGEENPTGDQAETSQDSKQEKE